MNRTILVCTLLLLVAVPALAAPNDGPMVFKLVDSGTPLPEIILTSVPSASICEEEVGNPGVPETLQALRTFRRAMLSESVGAEVTCEKVQGWPLSGDGCGIFRISGCRVTGP